MDDDDAAPRPVAARRNLAPLSVSDLEAYIAELEAEIARVQGEISAKRAHLSSAESVFRKG